MREQTTTPPTYEIRTLNDFTKVPKRRLKACLREFAVAIELTQAMEALISETESVMYGSRSIRAPLDVFRWIDDGKKNITGTIHIPPPPEA